MATKSFSVVAVTDAAPVRLLQGAPDISSVLIINTGAVAVELCDAGDAFGAGIPLAEGQWLQFDDVQDSFYGIVDTTAGEVRVAVIRGGGHFVSHGLIS